MGGGVGADGGEASASEEPVNWAHMAACSQQKKEPFFAFFPFHYGL